MTSIEQFKERWIPYEDLKKYFNYGSTQMCLLLRKLTVAKIGKRRFILKESIEKLLEQNIQ